MPSRKQKLVKQLKTKYKLVVLNHDTFEENISFTLNLLNVFVGVGVGSMVLMFLSACLIIFTPLKEYIPGYADVSLKKNVAEAAMKADSLEQMFRSQQKYLENVKNVIDGKVGSSNADSIPQLAKSAVDLDKKYPNDVDDLRDFIEGEEKNNVEGMKKVSSKYSIADLQLVKPVEGKVMVSYDLKSNKAYEVIATGPKAEVKSVANGIVLYSGLTTETGYVLIIQHAANVISIYKNCSAVFKKTGNYVNVGELIAITGNNGKEINGPQLAFELWSDGVSVNPAEHLKF
ncbi:M23 family metallopeptidase [Solitalea sp. MAHUQ-68]|uniref:M23 family metallopeptidase n=1 Tax=Solitalea agri TaxID=2953739 RepID=A0A9X2F2I7_9SPHI|nr:M23 family metallopeptidase [Solitalea agri]MCO4293507.1 M23 family metallopeptidase [Solitalea agri]